MVQALRRESIPVVVCQAIQVRAYARLQLNLGKNNLIEDDLIVASVAWVDNVRDRPDTRFDVFTDAHDAD